MPFWALPALADYRSVRASSVGHLNLIYSHPALTGVVNIRLSIVEHVGRRPRVSSVDCVATGESRILDNAAGLLDVFQVREALSIELEGCDESISNVVIHVGQTHRPRGARNEKVIRKLRRTYLHESCPIGPPL